MTRLQRLQKDLDEKIAHRNKLMRGGNFVKSQVVQIEIEELEAAIAEAKLYEPQRLSDLLSDREECVKNEIYKNLLRISLIADAADEAAHLAKESLQRYGIDDFSFRQKIKTLCKLTGEIAAIPLLAKGSVMEDFITNDDKFVELVLRHANAYIKRKLKL